MEEAGIQQQFHHLGNPTGAVEIHRDVTATGFEITDHRNALSDLFKVVDGQCNAGRAGYGQQMQHGIGGATHRHDHADGIFKGLPGHQIERADAGLDRLHQHLGRSGCTVSLFLIFSGHGGAVGKAQPHRFDSSAHGVGGEHAAAAASTRAGIFLNGRELLFVDLAAGDLAYRFKRTHHGEVAAAQFSRLDGAAVHKDRRDVHPCHREHGSRHVFVAAADGQHAIHALAIAGCFDGVGDHFPAHQGIFHSLGAHRDAVADGDGSEGLWHSTGQPGRLFGTPG